MLFCLSLCDETKRAILDQDYHGEVLTMIEGRDWQEAREAAIRNQVMDAYRYKPGYGWERRVISSAPEVGGAAAVAHKTA